MSQQILSLKLISGEEIIGRLEGETDEVLTLSKVRVIQMVQTGPQTMGMAMVPFMASNVDADMPIKKAMIVIDPMAPSAEAETPYLQQTTSIALVP